MFILRFTYSVFTFVGLAVIFAQLVLPPLPLSVIVPASIATFLMAGELFFGQGKHSEPVTVRFIFTFVLLALLVAAWVVWSI